MTTTMTNDISSNVINAPTMFDNFLNIKQVITQSISKLTPKKILKTENFC